MVITILEGNVPSGQEHKLQQAFRDASKNIPPQLKQSFLIHSTAQPNVWKIITVWKDRQSLEQMRSTTEVPAGILMFRSAGTEPSLSILDVEEYIHNISLSL